MFMILVKVSLIRSLLCPMRLIRVGRWTSCFGCKRVTTSARPWTEKGTYYDEPTRHFRFSDEGITNEIDDGRRTSSYFVPIARPKKKGSNQFHFDTEWTQDRIEENKLVNDIRRRVALWRKGGYVAVRQLVEDFGRYLYLPRLQTSTVLLNAIRTGLALLTWEHDAFAYAENYDESAGRYRGLRFGALVNVAGDDTGLLIRPEVARRQIDRETTETNKVKEKEEETEKEKKKKDDDRPPKPKRYHGTVILDSARVGRDAGRIADEVVTHLVGLIRSSVRVTLEIEAEIPDGAPDNVVRTVTENSRTLKFTSNSGFETE